MAGIDDIEILEHVDSGLYGSVYRASQKSLGRYVAVKIIKTDMKTADALAHAAPLARVSHPSIVTVHSVQEVAIPTLNRCVPAIVMEWIQGETLGKRLSQSRFRIDEAKVLCCDILDGIAHLHEHGLCHRDLHGGNVIILPTGRAKIIDIDANKEISLAKLSDLSQEGAKSADVDYCRGVIFKILRHSALPLSAVADGEEKLQLAESIYQLEQVVNSLCRDESDSFSVAFASDEWIDRIAKEATTDEVVALLDTQTYFELLNVPYPPTRDAVIEHLKAEGVIRAHGENWNITNLGAILFAKQLDKFGLSSKAARVIVYEGVNKLSTKTDVSGSRGYAVGFESLVNFVHEAAPKNEYLEMAIREEIKMFPKQALRELIANAMVHQDFSVDGTALRIEMYDDRVEISNPGIPQIPTERFIDEDLSRNERLAELMRQLGVCERKGSGVDKVVSAAEIFQLPAPDFRVGEIRTTSILYAHRTFADMTKSDRIRACYQHCVLQYISGKRMSNQSLRERFGLSGGAAGATASQIIAATKDANLIKSDDDGTSSLRYARYIPNWG